MFGFIKKLFGSKPVEKAQEAVEGAVDTVSEHVSGAADKVMEEAGHLKQAAEVELEEIGEAVKPALDEAKAAVARVVSDNDTPPPSDMSNVAYLDRDEFNLPRSKNVDQAVQLIRAQHGKPALAKVLRIFEYGMAGALAYDLRVDRELLALAALFSQAGDNAGEQAYAFAIKHGMWDALAEKIKSAIDDQGQGSSSDCRETRALALGVAAELAAGQVTYIHGATSAETRRYHAA